MQTQSSVHNYRSFEEARILSKSIHQAHLLDSGEVISITMNTDVNQTDSIFTFLKVSMDNTFVKRVIFQQTKIQYIGREIINEQKMQAKCIFKIDTNANLLDDNLVCTCTQVELKAKTGHDLHLQSKSFIIGKSDAHLAALKLNTYVNASLFKIEPLNIFEGCFPIWHLYPHQTYRLENISDKTAIIHLMEFYTQAKL